ncbi:MAG: hypothetical protein BZY80_07190 [SAR202 cluster bacterium Io17-Chloro-G2]|nr:MAG: hypothetical protein BZY80_07190 [SAR202 cluster bacterium Io17-Chloro-G2]
MLDLLVYAGVVFAAIAAAAAVYVPGKDLWQRPRIHVKRSPVGHIIIVDNGDHFQSKWKVDAFVTPHWLKISNGGDRLCRLEATLKRLGEREVSFYSEWTRGEEFIGHGKVLSLQCDLDPTWTLDENSAQWYLTVHLVVGPVKKLLFRGHPNVRLIDLPFMTADSPQGWTRDRARRPQDFVTRDDLLRFYRLWLAASEGRSFLSKAMILGASVISVAVISIIGIILVNHHLNETVSAPIGPDIATTVISKNGAVQVEVPAGAVATKDELTLKPVSRFEAPFLNDHRFRLSNTVIDVSTKTPLTECINIKMQISAVEEALADSEKSNIMIQRSHRRGPWEELPTEVDFHDGWATAPTCHLSLFALTIATSPPPESAKPPRSDIPDVVQASSQANRAQPTVVPQTGYTININGSNVEPKQTKVAFNNGEIQLSPASGIDGTYTENTTVTVTIHPSHPDAQVILIGVVAQTPLMATMVMDRDRFLQVATFRLPTPTPQPPPLPFVDPQDVAPPTPTTITKISPGPGENPTLSNALEAGVWTIPNEVISGIDARYSAIFERRTGLDKATFDEVLDGQDDSNREMVQIEANLLTGKLTFFGKYQGWPTRIDYLPGANHGNPEVLIHFILAVATPEEKKRIKATWHGQDVEIQAPISDPDTVLP